MTIALTVLTKERVTTAIRDAERESLQSFGCDSCAHATHESDGDFGEHQWVSCQKYDHLYPEHGFPFKIAPSGCFKLSTDSAKAWSALEWDDSLPTDESYMPNHSGVNALIRNIDATGRLMRCDVPDELVDPIYSAMTEEITWDDYLDGSSGAESTWRGFHSHVHSDGEQPKDIWEQKWDYVVSTSSADVDDSKTRDYRPAGKLAAQNFCEIIMREQAIRQLIGSHQNEQGVQH